MEKLKLLFAHVDLYWLEEVKLFFEETDRYTVETCKTGHEAKDKISKNQYFAVVLDFSLRNCSFIEVIQQAKLRGIPSKIILTLKSKESLSLFNISVKELLQIGVNDFVYGELTPSRLKRAVESHQNIQELLLATELKERSYAPKLEELEQDDTDFTSIPMTELNTLHPMLFDLYVRLRPNKYIKILHAGEKIEEHRIRNYRNKNIEVLYFFKDERLKYVSFCNHIASKLIASTEVEIESKFKATKGLVEKYVEELYTEDLNIALISRSKEIIENVYNLIHQDQLLLKTLHDYIEESDSEFTHSFLVCFYTCILVQQMDWGGQQNKENIALAAILHDIGRSQLPADLISKRPEDMNEEEKMLYQAHPQYGADLTSESQIVAPSISQVILQHHEKLDGSGFPMGLKASKILPASQWVSFSDAFTHYMIEHRLPPKTAIQEFSQLKNIQEQYNRDAFRAIKSVFFQPENE